MRASGRWSKLAAVLVLVLAASRAGAQQVPRVDTSDAEPRVQEKIERFRARLESSPSEADAWGRYGMVLEAHGFVAAAAAAYARAHELDSGEFRWPYYLAATYDASEPEVAIGWYQTALAIDHNYAAGHVRAAQTLEKLARDDEAREHYRRASQLDARNPFGPLGVGRIALRRGELEAALRDLERAHELNPNIHATVSALARAYHRAGRRQRAQELAAAAREMPRITLYPDQQRALIGQQGVDRNSYLRRSRTYTDVGMLEQALSELSTLLVAYADFAPGHLAMADLQSRRNDFVAAEVAARRALALDPGMTVARARLASALFELGRLAEAERVARAVLRSDPSDVSVHLLLSMLSGERGDTAAAIGHLQQAAELRPVDSPTRRLLARLLSAVAAAYFDIGEVAAAIRTMEQVVEIAAQPPSLAEAAGYRRALDRYRTRR